ncbi:Zinc finger protein 26 [Fasciola gigantica]|uniref:Zinc finger protein 26 n=1 Tax=Fasciola gigantica TaxID=46835 RepID=A0A504Z3V1_FASGI|nr:Zinc finger protein 26 [Fasciola gigantica]
MQTLPSTTILPNDSLSSINKTFESIIVILLPTAHKHNCSALSVSLQLLNSSIFRRYTLRCSSSHIRDNLKVIMVCDYLFCGTCFLNFRLSDITLFIEHKKNDCVAANATSSCGRPSPDNLMANLLECVQCFRKFPTAWPLLMHVQVEHQLLFANVFRQASLTSHEDRVPPTAPPSTFSEDRGLDLGQTAGSYNPILDEPGSSASTSSQILSTGMTPLATVSSSAHLVTVGTQTNMSWFRSQSRLVRKRALCCASATGADTPCVDADCPSAGRVCQCSGAQATDSICSCRCYCSQPGLKTITCPPFGTSADLQIRQCSDSSLDCYANSHPVENLSQPGPSSLPCCMNGNRLDCCSNSLIPSASQSMAIGCCPCPPAKRASMRSSEAQTDFDPEFSSPDYADIAMLLATPDRDSVYQPEVESITTVVDPTSWTQAPTETDLGTNEIPEAQMLTADEANYTNSNQPEHPALPALSPPAVSLPPVVPNKPMCLISPKQVDWISSTQHIPPEEVVALDSPYTLTTTTSALHITPHDATVARSVTHQFVCSECGNQYRQKVHLRKHIMTQHTRQKPYRCPSCDYTTVEKSHLTVHVRTHTGERPFICRECDYASAQNCTLKAHYIRKHLNSRIFCSKCDEPFYTELERTNHERLCLGNRLYLSSTIPGANISNTHSIKASGSPSRNVSGLL